MFNNNSAQALQNQQNSRQGHGYQTRSSSNSQNIQNNSMGMSNNMGLGNNNGNSQSTPNIFGNQTQGNNIFASNNTGGGSNIFQNNNKPTNNMFQTSGGSVQNIFQGGSQIQPSFAQNQEKYMEYRTQQ